MAEQVNYYEVLGVPRTASQAEIRNAYRSLAKERHPDHPSGSQAQFTLLQEAHAVLSDPNRRSQHNEALDLAHAADQLASLDLDFSGLEDELSSRRQQREASSGGPGLGERLRGRFRKEEAPSDRGRRGGGRDGGGRSGRGRYAAERSARWYVVQDFDPEPVTPKTGAISFVGAFLLFVLVGQIGLWAAQTVDPGPFGWLAPLKPFMPILYLIAGLATSYFAYRTAGYAGAALVFVAALIVGGQNGPDGILQFLTLGILVLVGLIFLGRRRDAAARGR